MRMAVVSSIPQPESIISIATPLGSVKVWIISSPPSGIASMAFLTKLIKAA